MHSLWCELLSFLLQGPQGFQGNPGEAGEPGSSVRIQKDLITDDYSQPPGAQMPLHLARIILIEISL